MHIRTLTLVVGVVALAIAMPTAQQPPDPDAKQVAQERRQAELDAPKLVDVLGVTPGMSIADVGSGGGAMTVVLGHWSRGQGRIFATDVTEYALRLTREYVQREGLSNVTVIPGTASETRLPEQCCHGAFLRLVYHHLTDPDAFNRSLYATLKPGARLAIIDHEPTPGSNLSAGVPANRGGHGVPRAIVEAELVAAGFTLERTFKSWPLDEKDAPSFLVLVSKNPEP